MIKNALRTLMMVAMLVAATTAVAQEATVVVDESFSAFTEGTAESPSDTDISGYTGKLAQTLSGWSGKKIYEAGGALLIGEGGYLQTTRYGMSTTNGNSRITLRLKAKASYGEAVSLYVSYNKVADFMLEDNEWKEVSVVTDRGTSSSYIKIQPMLEGVVVDRILVEQSRAFVIAPEAYQPTDADGSSFTARWKRVTGATGYLLNVYSMKEDGTRAYLIADAEYTTTSAKVEGLAEGTTYYFTVRAKVNDNVSEESEEIEVIKAISELEAPVALPATGVGANGFTANWNASADAEKYVLSVYCKESFANATTKNIVDEDFSGITIGEMNSIEFGSLTEALDAYTKVPGWVAHNHAFAAGYLVLAPFYDGAQLYTPQLDLRHKASITLRMAEYSYKYYTGGEVTVTLRDASDNALDTKVFTITGENFGDFTFTTDKGAESSYFEIAYSGSNKIYIDNVAIALSFEAGDAYNMVVGNYETSGTSHSVEVSAGDVEYSYNVRAVATTVDASGNIITVTSGASNTIIVDGHSHVDKVAACAAVTARSGSIEIAAADGVVAAVYDAGGRCVANTVVAGTATITVAPGFYIVKVAGSTVKVLVR